MRVSSIASCVCSLLILFDSRSISCDSCRSPGPASWNEPCSFSCSASSCSACACCASSSSMSSSNISRRLSRVRRVLVVISESCTLRVSEELPGWVWSCSLSRAMISVSAAWMASILCDCSFCSASSGSSKSGARVADGESLSSATGDIRTCKLETAGRGC